MRLTKEMRNTIIEEALRHRFAAARDRHEQMRAQLADMIYEDEIGEEERTVKTLSSRWRVKSDEIYIDHLDFGYKFRRKGQEIPEDCCLRLSRSRPMPPGGFGAFLIDKHHPQFPSACEVARHGLELRKEEEKAKEALSAMLHSVQTVAKLQELWPEGAQFLPTHARKPTSLVPVDQVAKVNRLLGLAAAEDKA